MATAKSQFKDTSIGKPRHDKLIVAAMDFGTTYSGYAFSLRGKPYDIITPQVWYAGETSRLASHKTPTCVLVNKNKEFDSFGFEAENRYAKLTEKNNHNEWYFFQHFKMSLSKEKKLTKTTLIEDITGKTMSAFTIFTMAISYLKEHLMATINNRVEMTIEDVYVILTVPAIWTDSAKQFMEEAAMEAGIDKENLELALEPEAASIYCQLNPTQVSEDKGSYLKAGTQYIVVDLGGGTVDITCHEKQIDNTIKELSKASGGAWGGLKVNENFMNFLIKFFGQSVMDRFKKEETCDYFELSREFEIRKRQVSPMNENFEIIRMPTSFKELYEDMTGHKVQDAIVTAGFEGKVTWVRDKLKIQANIVREFFSFSIDSTIREIYKMLLENSVKIVSRMILVGGFSECKIVQEALTTTFSEMQPIVPIEAGLAVLKGAVCFGQKPFITSRILRYTYGVLKNTKFDPELHPLEAKHADKEGVDRCKNYFHIIKSVGSSVSVGEKVTFTCHPTLMTQKKLRIFIYISNKESPLLTTEDGCTRIGKLTVRLPNYTGNERNVTQTYIFGETQLKVEATEPETGKKYETYVNLL